MGKGVPAAMFAAILRSLLAGDAGIDARTIRAADAGEPVAISRNSRGWTCSSPRNWFSWMHGSEKSSWRSAGHCPLVIAHGGEVKTFSPEGMPLGILADTTFHDETVALPENCRVLLYTDGLSEALNTQREYFGNERLMNWLQRTGTTPRSAEELKTELAHELETHQLNAGLNDDQTFLILAG